MAINYSDFGQVDIRHPLSFMSEVLTVGVANEQGQVVLVRPDKSAVLGSKLF